MKRSKQIIAFLLSVCMMIGMVPISARAEEFVEVTDAVACGDNLKWSVNDSGTLTITGEGEMYDYTVVNEVTTAPWKDYKDSINTITIAEGVTSIGDYAFYGLNNTCYVEFPETMEKIGDFAFAKTYIYRIEIPAATTFIGIGAFAEVPMYDGIHVSENNTEFSVIDCCLYTKDGSELIMNSGMGEISEGVEVIRSYALNSSNSVIIPASVKTIQEKAFAGYMGDKVQFLGNAIQFPQNLFEGLTLSVYCKADNETWTDDMFKEYGGSVRWYRVDENNKVVSGTCGENVFWKIENADTVRFYGVGKMDESFGEGGPWCDHRDDITKIVIEDGITSIGNSAFYYCRDIEEVSLGQDVEEIGSYVFMQCSSLKKINFPSSLKIINSGAFDGCRNLPEIYLPEKIEEIHNSAFRNIQMSEINIPESVSYFHPTAFGYYVEAFNVSEENIQYKDVDGVVYSKDGKTLCAYPSNKGVKEYTVLDGTSLIVTDSFYHNNNLQKLTLPASLSEIKSFAFGECNSLTGIWFRGDVPKHKGQTFMSVEATVYYPADNETWTIEELEDMESCGGTIDTESYVPAGTVSIISHPEDQIALEGDSVCFTVDATGEGLTYQWQYSVDGTNWHDLDSDGSDTKILTIVATTNRNGYMYRCEITDSTFVTVASNAATLTVNEELLVIITQPTDQSVYENEIARFDVDVDGNGLTYQWQYSNNGGKKWYNSSLEGSSTKTLSVKGESYRNGQMYRCLITNSSGKEIITEAVSLIVIEETFVILKQPESRAVPESEIAEFSVEVQGEQLVYQWQYSNNNGKNWYDSSMKGCHETTLFVKAEIHRNGQMYRCVIRDGEGREVISDSVQLLVDEEVFGIISQPKDVVSCDGMTATFSVEAEGDNLSYQWQYSNNQGKNWYNSGMEGSNTNTLNVKVTEKRDGQMYRCVVKNGTGKTEYSDEVIITIGENDIVIEKHPKHKKVKKGHYAKFWVEMDKDDYSYQWQYSKDGGKSWHDSTMKGYDTNELIVEATDSRHGHRYRCIIKDNKGQQRISDEAELIVTDEETGLSIISDPVDVEATAGTQVEFTVKAEGESLTYQWQYSMNGERWYISSMDGSDTDTLSMKATEKRNGQMYRCMISNAEGEIAFTGVGTLTVK